MRKNSHCRFCGFTLKNLKCPKCGCLTPFRQVVDDDVNVTFVDYSYNRYNQDSLGQKIYLSWMRLQAFLFAINTPLVQILNFLLMPLTGGKLQSNFSNKRRFP